MQLFTKQLEIFLAPKILEPPKSGALGLSLFSLMVNPGLDHASQFGQRDLSLALC